MEKHPPCPEALAKFIALFDAKLQQQAVSLDEVEEAARGVGKATLPGGRSVLEYVISQTRAPMAMASILDALIQGGCDPTDAHLPQRHDKVVNHALQSKSVAMANWLLEHGADANTLVPEWVRRPKTSGQGRDVVRFYELAWPRWDSAMQQRYLSSAVIGLVGAEIVGAVEANDALHAQLTQGLLARPEFNAWDRGLSTMNDALAGVKKVNKVIGLLDRAVARWRVALDAGGTLDPAELPRICAGHERIPQTWIQRLAEDLTTIRQHQSLDRQTPAVDKTRPAKRM